LERLLKDEIKSRFATNIVQSRKFSELLVDSLAKYRELAAPRFDRLLVKPGRRKFTLNEWSYLPVTGA
jgi:restriction endonuclease HindI-like protein